MAITVAANSKSGFYNSIDGTVEIDSIVPRWPYVAYETPEELTGTSAISVPTYNGIEQLMVLDKNWVIVMFDFSTELYDEIDTLSSGDLTTQYDIWVAAVNNPPIPGGAFVNRNNMWAIRAEHMAQARKNIGELTLETTTAYGITSTDDAAYSSSQNPTTAARYCYSAGNDTTYQPIPDSYSEGAHNGVFQVAYFACGYIQFPTSMVDGKTYTITVLGKTATFLFDRKKTISRAIKINQAGYLPAAASKKAYIGAHLYEEGALDLTHALTAGWEVINADTGAIADSGAAIGSVTLNEADPEYTPGGDKMFGEDVYEIDFSSLTDTGTFYISVPGVGRSWPFEHSTTVYNYAAYTSTRGNYHHRAGSELTTKYTHWARRKAKTGPFYYECENIFFPQQDTDFPAGYNIFTAIQNTLDLNQITVQAPGGTHDAADWDCRGFHYASIAHLLYAFQLNTNLTSDSWLDIPESGDGVPDMLSQARYELEIWRLSQDVSGGVSGYLETNTHPNVTHSPDSNGIPWRKSHYAFGQRTRWQSLMFAACAAQYARLVFSYDATDSALYEAAAVAAYDFGNNPSNSLGATTLDGFSWTELDSMVDPYLMWAKLQLWLLTGTDTYITDSPSVATLEARSQGHFVWTWTQNDYSIWIYYSIIEASNAGYTALDATAATILADIVSDADTAEAEITNNPYEKAHLRTAGPSRWALQTPTMWSSTLIIAHKEKGLAKYRDALIKNLDFQLGANCLGTSWCTGIGSVYPVHINNEVTNHDGIMDPVPGITLYGITTDDGFGGGGASMENDVWRATLPGDGVTTSITQTGGTATATMVADHGLTTGERVEILGAAEAGYNVTGVATVTGAKTFEYPVDSGTASPATSAPVAYRDFTYPSHRSPAQPKWRRFMQHPTNNVPQNEYTIHETMAPMQLATCYLATGAAVTQKTPRDPQYLWGRWLLP